MKIDANLGAVTHTHTHTNSFNRKKYTSFASKYKET